jgi:hypothetical protein
MIPIDLALFDARDRALPGREAAALNELCRAIVELASQAAEPGRIGRAHHACDGQRGGAATRLTTKWRLLSLAGSVRRVKLTVLDTLPD